MFECSGNWKYLEDVIVVLSCVPHNFVIVGVYVVLRDMT